ncbi:unnamed protein product [Choristocarpus tenellus]
MAQPMVQPSDPASAVLPLPLLPGFAEEPEGALLHHQGLEREQEEMLEIPTTAVATGTASTTLHISPTEGEPEEGTEEDEEAYGEDEEGGGGGLPPSIEGGKHWRMVWWQGYQWRQELTSSRTGRLFLKRP